MFRDVGGVRHEDSQQIFVHCLECFSVISTSTSESDGEHIPFQISGNAHFKAIIPAFWTMCPRRESAHRPVALSVFRQTDGNVGGVSVFDNVCVFLIPTEN